MTKDITVLKSVLDAVEPLLAGVQQGDDCARLRQELATVQTAPVTVLVCGEFKRGKSTFINALIGRDVCPTDIDICTSVVSIIKYGERERVVRYYGELSSLASEEIDMEDLPDYTVGSATEIGNTVYVEIELPLPALRDGIAVIDTPGVGGLDPRHGALTSYFLPRADVTVFVTDVSEPLTETELTFYRGSVLPAARHNAVIVNKADLKAADEVADIKSDTATKISAVTGISPEHINIVSLSSAAEAYPDMGLGDSNFGTFRDILAGLATRYRRVHLESLRDRLSEMMRDSAFSIEEQIRAIDEAGEDRLPRLTEMKEEQDRKLAELSNPNSPFRISIDKVLAAERETVMRSLNRATINLQGEVLDRLLDDPCAHDSDIGGKWVGDKLNEHLRSMSSELTRQLNDAFARISMMPEFDGMLTYQADKFKGTVVEQNVDLSIPFHKRIMPMTSGLGVLALGSLCIGAILPGVGWVASAGLAAYVAWKNVSESSSSYQNSRIVRVYQPQINAAVYDLRTYVDTRFSEFQKEWVKVLGDRITACRKVIVDTIDEIQHLKKDAAKQAATRAVLQNKLKSINNSLSLITDLKF